MYDFLKKIFSDGEVLMLTAGIVFLSASIIKYFYTRKLSKNIYKTLATIRAYILFIIGLIFIFDVLGHFLFNVSLSPVTDYFIILLLILQTSNLAVHDFLILEGLK